MNSTATFLQTEWDPIIRYRYEGTAEISMQKQCHTGRFSLQEDNLPEEIGNQPSKVQEDCLRSQAWFDKKPTLEHNGTYP